MNKVAKFLNQSFEEIKKIEWPSKKSAIRLTAYVIGISFATGLFIMLFDYIFKELLTLILTK